MKWEQLCGALKDDNMMKAHFKEAQVYRSELGGRQWPLNAVTDSTVSMLEVARPFVAYTEKEIKKKAPGVNKAMLEKLPCVLVPDLQGGTEQLYLFKNNSVPRTVVLKS